MKNDDKKSTTFTTVVIIVLSVVIIILLFLLFLCIKKKGCSQDRCPKDTVNFPNSVLILDPSDGDIENQKKVDEIWKKHGEQSALRNVQFGKYRTLILLKPGNYGITINVGFYMSVAGLGKSPADVTVAAVLSHVITDTSDHGHSTQCFWRSAENLTITPNNSVEPKNTNTWSVSQACPLRRIICNGTLSLVDHSLQAEDWASGGFIADSQINGDIDPSGQQQWFTRNTSMNDWLNLKMWNYVFVGCEFNNPKKRISTSCGEGKNVYVNPKTPIIAQKPTLFLDKDGNYNILRPRKVQNTQGPPNWTDGDVIPLSKFYITNCDDNDKTINNAIERNLHIFLSPGIYYLEDSININKNNTMILGYGMPTLVAKNKPAIVVQDVDDVVVASVILSVADNGKVSSLLQWGTKKDNHPGIAYDIFTRVGGDTTENTYCEKMVVINSNNVIGDNFWLWRADHGNGVGWDKNIANNALEVNGDNCIIYGLAGEHTQKDIINWRGDNGTVYFYQSEMAYDGGYGGKDYEDNVVSYRVSGNNHKGYGLGVYGFFGVPDSDLKKKAIVKNGFVTPKDAEMTNIYIMNASKAGGGFEHIINGDGDGVKGKGPKPKFSYKC